MTWILNTVTFSALIIGYYLEASAGQPWWTTMFLLAISLFVFVSTL